MPQKTPQKTPKTRSRSSRGQTTTEVEISRGVQRTLDSDFGDSDDTAGGTENAAYRVLNHGNGMSISFVVKSGSTANVTLNSGPTASGGGTEIQDMRSQLLQISSRFDTVEKSLLQQREENTKLKELILGLQEKNAKLQSEVTMNSTCVDDLMRNTSHVHELNRLRSEFTMKNARLCSELTNVHKNLRSHPLLSASTHLLKCIDHQIACDDAVNAFISLHTLEIIDASPSLTLQLKELKKDLKKAWDARFSAARLCKPPPTLEDVLWIVAKNGFTYEVAPMMNLSKATRECKNLQRVMREVRNRNGATQLFYYCSLGMTSSVVRMLQMQGIDVESIYGEQKYNMSCLMIAAVFGYVDICRLLIDKGAEIDAKDSDDMTPLHMSVWNDHIEVVRLLCDRGANTEARDKFRITCLMFAVSCGHPDLCRLLIEKGAQLEARDEKGKTCLHLSVVKGNIGIINLLCDRGANIEARTSNGMRPLHLAVAKGKISVVKELLEKRNAEINARDNHGWSPLYIARCHDHDDIDSYLVSRGGDDFYEEVQDKKEALNVNEDDENDNGEDDENEDDGEKDEKDEDED